jgi:hypothetical protein
MGSMRAIVMAAMAAMVTGTVMTAARYVVGPVEVPAAIKAASAVGFAIRVARRRCEEAGAQSQSYQALREGRKFHNGKEVSNKTRRGLISSNFSRVPVLRNCQG